MRRFFILFFCQGIFFSSGAQKQFETIVPLQTVVPGESFQVQYIIRDAEKISNFNAPVFTHFRFVSGPNKYKGSVTTANGIKPIQNFVYTLEAINPGRFTINGASVMLNGKPVKSNDVLIDVVSTEKAVKPGEKNTGDAASDYFLMPGEDPYEKIRQNLFLKLVVDRTTCFAGEPVLAIFKLYSRLESNSDIVKNPGFYGFTVQDMVNLSDKQIITEMVNGKVFDVHTIRKIQLYPLRAGTFIIDAMEVKNKIEFSRSAVNKKTEQEIVEGVLGNGNPGDKKENTELFETKMNTAPVIIRVMPVPEKNKPGNFNGAVGAYSIYATVKDRLARNEEGIFEVTIRGYGNFTQLNAPVITWPEGIEGFEPVVSDSLDKSKFPLTGSRTFRYSFICNKPGLYPLPAIKFSFFNPQNSRYETVSTTAAQVEISTEEKRKRIVQADRKESIVRKNARASKVAAGIILLLTLLVLIYWISYKDQFTPAGRKEMTLQPSVDEVFAPVSNLLHASDKEYCTLLLQSIWKYLGSHLGLEGSGMNKEILYARLKQEGVEDGIVTKVHQILTECEMGMFTGAAIDLNKVQMLADTREAMESVNRSLL